MTCHPRYTTRKLCEECNIDIVYDCSQHVQRTGLRDRETLEIERLSSTKIVANCYYNQLLHSQVLGWSKVVDTLIIELNSLYLSTVDVASRYLTCSTGNWASTCHHFPYKHLRWSFNIVFFGEPVPFHAIVISFTFLRYNFCH